jgi:hypothetical protein
MDADRRDIVPVADDLVGARKPTGQGRTWRRAVHAVAVRIVTAHTREEYGDIGGLFVVSSLRLLLPMAVLCGALSFIPLMPDLLVSSAPISALPIDGSVQALVSLIETARPWILGVGLVSLVGGLFLG